LKFEYFSTLARVFFLSLVFLSCAPKVDENLYLTKTHSVVSVFKNELQSNLLKAVQERGAENSIEVCSELSPKIEAKIASENNLQIRRVSEKFRNPNHEPDAWEKKVLQKWTEDLKNGKKLAVYSEIQNADYRVMNPIVLENPNCLQCHGGFGDIKPGTLKKIQDKYPKDKAQDYKLGELRGAFSSRWKI
jgi:hypothetical protein